MFAIKRAILNCQLYSRIQAIVQTTSEQPDINPTQKQLYTNRRCVLFISKQAGRLTAPVKMNRIVALNRLQHLPKEHPCFIAKESSLAIGLTNAAPIQDAEDDSQRLLNERTAKSPSIASRLLRQQWLKRTIPEVVRKMGIRKNLHETWKRVWYERKGYPKKRTT